MNFAAHPIENDSVTTVRTVKLDCDLCNHTFAIVLPPPPRPEVVLLEPAHGRRNPQCLEVGPRLEPGLNGEPSLAHVVSAFSSRFL
jgi:hypothetical protein